MRARGASLLALAAAIPWCCALPAVLVLMGLAGAARRVALELRPFLLAVSLLLPGWSHYLIYVRRQGAPWARRLVWISTALVASMWLPR